MPSNRRLSAGRRPRTDPVGGGTRLAGRPLPGAGSRGERCRSAEAPDARRPSLHSLQRSSDRGARGGSIRDGWSRDGSGPAVRRDGAGPPRPCSERGGPLHGGGESGRTTGKGTVQSSEPAGGGAAGGRDSGRGCTHVSPMSRAAPEEPADQVSPLPVSRSCRNELPGRSSGTAGRPRAGDGTAGTPRAGVDTTDAPRGGDGIAGTPRGGDGRAGRPRGGDGTAGRSRDDDATAPWPWRARSGPLRRP